MGSFNGVSPHSGSFQAVVSNTSATISQTLATTAGQSYAVSFWAAATGASPGTVMNAQWGDLGQVFIHHFAVGNTPYTEFTFNVTADSASTIFAFGIGGPGSIFLDDVSVTPAGVPDGGTTVMLLGTALGALGMARRFLKA